MLFLCVSSLILAVNNLANAVNGSDAVSQVLREGRGAEKGGGGRGGGTEDLVLAMTHTALFVDVEVLLYVHRNRMFIRDGSP